ncbi:Sir2 family NAD-dependent protein deacetylase [Pannonibacter sp. Pt2-lr]
MPRQIDDLTAAQAALTEVFSGGGRIVVLTGAGISTESGIPDYRSPGGIWSRMAPVQYADFVEDKAQRLEDWRRRFIFTAISAARTRTLPILPWRRRQRPDGCCW